MKNRALQGARVAARRVAARIGAAWRDRRGAVHVDWMVLTAGVLALTFSVSAAFEAELDEIAVSTFLHASAGIDAMR